MLTQKPLKERAQDVKDRTDLRLLAASLIGGQRKRQAARYDQYFSPFRDDGQRASFTVYADGYYDEVTGESGSCIDFVMNLYRYDLKAAVEFLEAYHGGVPAIEAKPIIRSKQSAQDKAAAPDAGWQAAMQDVIETAHANLLANPAAYAYLHDVRGLSDDTIKQYRLGYFEDWHRTGYRDANGEVVVAPGILIPWQTDGQLFALRIRCRTGNLAEALGIIPDTFFDSKYASVRGSRQSATVYNGDVLQAGEPVLLVEGEFDVLLAQQYSDMAVVTRGSAGSHRNMPATWLDRLQSCSEVLSLLDNDDAGRKATDALNEQLSAPLKLLELPQGKDISDYLLLHEGDFEQITAQPDKANEVADSKPQTATSYVVITVQNEKAETTGSTQQVITTTLEAESAAWWEQGMPDSWRSMLLNHFHNSTAVVFDAVNAALQADLLDPNALTVQDVAEVTGISSRVVDDVFRSQDNVFLQKLGAVPPTDSPRVFAKKAGRTPDYWQVRSLDEILPDALDVVYRLTFEELHVELIARPTERMAKALNLTEEERKQWDASLEDVYIEQDNQQDQAANRAAYVTYTVWAGRLRDPHSTPLAEDRPANNTANYRAALLRGLVKNNPGAHSRSALASLLGMSDSNLDAVYQRAGVVTEQRFVDVPIVDPQNIPQAINKARRENGGGYPLKMVSISPEGDEAYMMYSSEYAASYAQSEIDEGRELIVRLQLTSMQRIATPQEEAECEAKRQAKAKRDRANRLQRESRESERAALANMRRAELEAKAAEEAKSSGRPPQRPIQPQATYTPSKPPEVHYGPDHDPLWLFRQLQDSLDALPQFMWFRGNLYDANTGELLIVMPSLRQMVYILCGADPRTIHEYEPHDHIDERAKRCDSFDETHPLFDEWMADVLSDIGGVLGPLEPYE